MSKRNLSELLILKIKKENWNIHDLISATFALELDYVIKYSKRFEWTAHKFVGDSTQTEISDLADSLKATIRKDKKDALVLVKETSNFFWVSISMKNLKTIGIFEKPRYIAVSADGIYFFTKDIRSDTVTQYVISTLGYGKGKRKKLSGKCLKTLLKLLVRKEKADMNNRPVFQRGEAIENEHGLDFTQKKHYFDYFDKCVDNETDITLESFTISSANCPWMGDDTPVLRNLEYKSSLTLTGNVAGIIKQLPLTSIVKAPLPNYLNNFSVYGRNIISVKPSLLFS